MQFYIQSAFANGGLHSGLHASVVAGKNLLS